MNTEALYQKYLASRLVCTDTRMISAGCIFFALKGDSFDGNAFAEAAIQAGAGWAVVDDQALKTNGHFIFVEDVLTSLQDLARHHRKQLDIPFIAITGSNGKTTTKELLYSVLSQHCKTHATSGNLNNHIGVPLTILSIPEGTEIAIIEMGANHQKEIALLCSIALPTHGLITNVGKAHLEGFGGFEGVKTAKGELYEFLAKSNSAIFINSDNHHLVSMRRERNVQKVISYGGGTDNYVSAFLTKSAPYLEVAWHREAMELDDRTHIAQSNLTGTYNLENILAAICIGTFFKLPPDQINRGIKAYQPSNYRSQLVETKKNTLICDYYNANPSSMAVALDNLENAAQEPKAFILGDMFELGEDTGAEHLAIVQQSPLLKTQRNIFIGEEFFKHKDQATEKAEFYLSTDDAYGALKENPLTGFLILVKGSRGMKLEKLIELL